MTLISRLAALALSLFAGLMPAWAQNFPERPIKLVAPFPPGSATDAVARMIAEEMRKGLGQTVIVENQAGADGVIAAQAVKRAAPDGHTLMISTNSAHGSNKALYAQLPYDPEKDFEPIGGVMRIPQLMVVRKDFPANDIAGFVQLARSRTGTQSYSFGTGNTSSRIAAELLKGSAKIEMTAVPYRGTPQALQDLVGGQIDLFFADPFAASALMSSGQIKALAITDTSRLATLPDVPTMAEAGHRTVELVSFVAIFAPARTDPVIVDRLNKELNRVLALPQFREFLTKMGAVPMVTTPAELRSFVSTEVARYVRLVEMAGIPKK